MNYSYEKNHIRICSDKNHINLEFLKDGIVRVYKEKAKQDLYELNERKDLLVKQISVSNGKLYIDYYNSTKIEVDEHLNVCFVHNGNTFLNLKFEEDLIFNERKFNQISFDVSDDSRIMGLGDKMSMLNKKGYHYQTWATDDSNHQDELFENLYKAINYLFLYSYGRYFGMFFPSSYQYDYDLAKWNLNRINVQNSASPNDVYVVIKDTPKEVLSSYSSLVGHPYFIRLKMFGNQQSRWSYENEEQVMDVFNNYKKHDLPLDYIHLDIHYMDGYRDFTVDKTRFPDLKRLSNTLKEGGVELVAINDAGIKVDENYTLYDYCVKNNLVSKNSDGTLYIGKVWPGDSIFPIYYSPKMKKHLVEVAKDFVESNGISGIWNDMNEPVSFTGELPKDLDFSFGKRELKHDECHNLLAEHMVKDLVKVFHDRNQRPYNFSRSGFATTAKYSFAWNGDNFSLWHHLKGSIPQILSLGLSNYMFDGVDIGGFGGDCNKQLLIRWCEGNILMPFFRNHSSLHTKAQEPYAYDQETIDIYRKFLNFRYSMIPLMYDLAHKMSTKGEMIVRPLFYVYPDDERCLDINDQYMVGDNLLLAPILEQDKYERIAYFPKGVWYDYFTGEKIIGGKSMIIQMPLDQTGVYVKNNSIIPTYENVKSLNKNEIDTVVFKLFGSKGKYQMYEDDGDSLDYKKGVYNLYDISFDKKQFAIKVRKNGYQSTYKHIKIVKNNRVLEANWDGKDLILSLED